MDEFELKNYLVEFQYKLSASFTAMYLADN